MFKVNQGRNALLALLLLVPAPSIGVATQLYISPGSFGQLVALLSKIWLLVIPIGCSGWIKAI